MIDLLTEDNETIDIVEYVEIQLEMCTLEEADRDEYIKHLTRKINKDNLRAYLNGPDTDK